MNEGEFVTEDVLARTPLDPDAPAPRTQALAAVCGQKLTAAALRAWQARISGTPIIDLAYGMDLTIAEARALIREVHEAIAEDLKENLSLNRELDLARLDGLLERYYPRALEGDVKSAGVVLKLLQHRAQLTGIEPTPEPGRSPAVDVLVWVQAQLPSINRIVDALPLD